MDSKEFVKKYLDLFKKDGPNYAIACEKYVNNKDFTYYITEKLKDLLKSDENYDVSTEYYRIDVSSWEQLRDKNELNPDDEHKLSTYLWNFEVAVEHENDDKAWMDEIVKLLHIICPLRVVICYLPMKQRDKDLYYLNKIYEKIKTLYAFENNNFDKNEFIVIIGNSKCEKKEENFFNYHAYKLTKIGFEVFSVK